MAEVSIKTVKNGPLEIWGGARLVDDAEKKDAESAASCFICAVAAFENQAVLQQQSRRSRVQSRRNSGIDAVQTQYSIPPILKHANRAG